MSLDLPASVDELLNYRLARLLAVTSVPGVRLLEGRFSVTRREWGLLGLLAAYGEMSPSELSARSHLEPSKVSLNITDLVAKGLLVRVAVPSDRRRARIDLTPRGRQLYEEAFPQLVALTQSMLRSLSKRQIELLDQIMRTLSSGAERLNEQIPVPERADRRRGGSRVARRQGAAAKKSTPLPS